MKSLRNYEAILILKYDVSEETVSFVVSSVLDNIKSEGGSILLEERWEKKRLAYPIKKYKSGYYLLLKFNAAPGSIKELERSLKYSDPVLRAMIVIDEQKETLLKEDKDLAATKVSS